MCLCSHTITTVLPLQRGFCMMLRAASWVRRLSAFDVQSSSSALSGTTE